MSIKKLNLYNLKRLLVVLLFCNFLSTFIASAQKFVIPVFPDSQTEVMARTDMFNSQMNWIVQNKRSLNIPIVLHVGDIVNFDNVTHWQNASNGFNILDQANIPYAVCLGNHDTEAVGENSGSAAPGNVNENVRKTTKFNANFPVSRFPAQKGRYEEGKSDNAFYTFNAGGLKWLVLSLEFCSRQGPVDWANSIIPQYSDYNVIVLTHYHLSPDGSISTSNAGYGDLSPSKIFDQFIKKHANIVMVLSGHVQFTSYRTDLGENGNRIYQMLQDYQDQDYGGGYLRLLEIDTELKTISAKMYSPFYDITKEDASKFQFSNIKFIGNIVYVTPIIKISSGVTEQKVSAGQSISDIAYNYSGTATGFSISWTGTENAATAPDGVIVTLNDINKSLTISGKLNKVGTYGYLISAIDGTNISSELGGTLIGDVVPTSPIIKSISGPTDQKVYPGQSISNIVYSYSGNAISSTIKWTGTANNTTAPVGIIVTVDAATKSLTISGNLNQAGAYGYSITSTDGTNISNELTGMLTAKSTTKNKLAYVTTVTGGTAAALDMPFIDAFNNDNFEVTVIPSISTNVDYSHYDLIVLSAVPNSGDAALAELKTITQSKPFVNMKMFVLNNGRWSWLLPYNSKTCNTISVPDSTKLHPIFNNIPFTGASANEIKLTNATSGNMVSYAAWLSSSTASANPRVLATVQENAAQYNSLEIPIGTRMNGMATVTTAKHIVLGLNEASWGSVTPNAVKIAVNAANYVVALPPVMSLSTGTSTQTVTADRAISNVVYTYSGTVTSTNVSWTGTANSSTAPAGIIVTTDPVAQSITFSGIPTTEGIYGFNVSATDGAVVSKSGGALIVSITTGTQITKNNPKIIVSKEFYDITGKQVNAQTRGLLIEKSIYSDGTNSFKKVFRTFVL